MESYRGRYRQTKDHDDKQNDDTVRNSHDCSFPRASSLALRLDAGDSALIGIRVKEKPAREGAGFVQPRFGAGAMSPARGRARMSFCKDQNCSAAADRARLSF